MISQLLFIRNIPIMIGGVASGLTTGLLLWFFHEPLSFGLFLSRRLGIDPAIVTGALGTPKPEKK
jgi:hypothetical protein